MDSWGSVNKRRNGSIGRWLTNSPSGPQRMPSEQEIQYAGDNQGGVHRKEGAGWDWRKWQERDRKFNKHLVARLSFLIRKNACASGHCSELPELKSGTSVALAQSRARSWVRPKEALALLNCNGPPTNVSHNGRLPSNRKQWLVAGDR